MVTPVIAASGTYGYGLEYDGLVDWSLVGGVSVKGLSAEPWQGHGPPRMTETPSGVLNAIGLHNIGAEAFLADKLPALARLGPAVIANCWGHTTEEFVRVVECLDTAEQIRVLELNLSCPHNPSWGGVLAADPKATEEVVTAVRAVTRKPLWVKLSPNVTDITVVARAAEAAGADALTVMNTLRGLAIDIEERRPVLGNGAGGLSGPAVKPVALFLVHQCARAVGIPIVGVGGISRGRDVVEFLMAGASAVEVGTANLYDPSAPSRLARETRDCLARLGEGSVAGVIGTLDY